MKAWLVGALVCLGACSSPQPPKESLEVTFTEPCGGKQLQGRLLGRDIDLGATGFPLVLAPLGDRPRLFALRPEGAAIAIGFECPKAPGLASDPAFFESLEDSEKQFIRDHIAGLREEERPAYLEHAARLVRVGKRPKIPVIVPVSDEAFGERGPPGYLDDFDIPAERRERILTKDAKLGEAEREKFRARAIDALTAQGHKRKASSATVTTENPAER